MRVIPSLQLEISTAELLMRLGVFGCENYSFFEVRQTGFGMLLVDQKHPHIDVGLSISLASPCLPGNGCSECLGRFFYLVETLIRQAKIVFSFYVMRIELEARVKRIDGFGKAILVVLRAPQIVPTVRIRGIHFQGLGKPLVRVQEIT